MTVLLIQPCLDYESSYRSYIDELGDAERYPFPLEFDHDNFPALIERLDNGAKGIGLPKGFVPSSTYWLIEQAEIVGVSNLRHRLNDALRAAGGHIGLGIRPSCQGRGLGKKLLAMTLAEARIRGIADVHVHCMKDNRASAGMILANGGILDSETTLVDTDAVVQRYVIFNG
ncbi:MAG: GNAT family N-acetyltransferase [Pseudomonadota bacterium]